MVVDCRLSYNAIPLYLDSIQGNSLVWSLLAESSKLVSRYGLYVHYYYQDEGGGISGTPGQGKALLPWSCLSPNHRGSEPRPGESTATKTEKLGWARLSRNQQPTTGKRSASFRIPLFLPLNQQLR